jgi:hypothetical protein
MTLTIEIIWVALTNLMIGFVLGYAVRSQVSLLRNRRVRRNLYPKHTVQDRRMKPQGDHDWRMELERDLSQVTTAPGDDASGPMVKRSKPH